jgi:hypothetical protein
MSELRLHPEALPPTNEPLRLAVRRLRWFKAAFLRYVDGAGRELGCRFEVDEGRLAALFVRWLDSMSDQKPQGRDDRRDFFEFAASLMLRELTADMPLRVVGTPARAAPGSAAAVWPEGYVCTMFCLSVHCAAVEQEFHAKVVVDPAVDDLRHWWSFRENAREDSNLSAGFLQMLLGRQPNWLVPTIFRERITRSAPAPE